MRDLAILLTTAAALSSCNLAPRYVTPTLPIAEAFPDIGYGAAVASDLGWRYYFVDEGLRALIAQALANNRDLAQSFARVEQARAQYRIQAVQALTGVEATGSAARSRQPLTGAGGSGDGDQYSVAAGVSDFELDLWGRVRNLSEAQRARYLATVEGARAYQLSLIGQVAVTYIAIQGGRDRIALAEQTLTSWEESLRLAQRRLDAGVTSTIDYDQAELLVGQARAQLAELHRATEQSRNLLQVLVGGPLSRDALPTVNLADIRLETLAAGVPSSVLLNRPDVIQAEHRLRAANANIGVARAAFLATISLTGQYGSMSPDLADLFKSGAETWSYGAGVGLPIFDWGRRSANLKLSCAQVEEMTATYLRAVQEAFKEVSDGLAAHRRYAEQLDVLTQTVAAQQRLAHTAQHRYDNGASAYLEVLNAERGLFSTPQDLIALRATSLQNRVALYVALGGGTGAGQ